MTMDGDMLVGGATLDVHIEVLDFFLHWLEKGVQFVRVVYGGGA